MFQSHYDIITIGYFMEDEYMDNQLIPNRLIKARESLGLTKAEASRKIGLSKIGYCRYEYGERIPSPQMMEIIAQSLNTSSEYLTGQTDDMSPNCILIKKEDTPELFKIVEELSSTDQKMLKRILTYYEKIKK